MCACEREVCLVAFVCCCFACDCVLELVVCRVRFARVSCPRLRFGKPTNPRPSVAAQSVIQSVISRSRPALTPPPARSPAPPLPVEHKYRVLAPGGYSIVASEVKYLLHSWHSALPP